MLAVAEMRGWYRGGFPVWVFDNSHSLHIGDDDSAEACDGHFAHLSGSVDEVEAVCPLVGTS